MPLKTIDTSVEWYQIHFDGVTQIPWLIDNDGEPIDPTEVMETAYFGLKRITTREFRDITNRMYKISRKGGSSFEYGTAAYQKILAACKKCRNVGDGTDPEKEIPFTEKLLDELPQWVSDKLLDKINEMNSLTPETEED
jgi:hypothetical protein